MGAEVYEQQVLFEDPAATATELIGATAVHEAVQLQPEISKKRVAFGGFVKPEMYDVFGDYDLGSVTQAEIDWMKPETLGKYLFEPGRDAKFTVDGVALNATEHGIVARSPFKLAEKAEEQTLKDKDLNDEELAKAARSQVHALEGKLDAMTGHRAKLAEQRAMVKELAGEAKKPGYAHKTEERMKELTSAVWNELTNVLDVVHIQREWTDDKRKKAETALIHHLTQGSQRLRVNHWQAMIGLTDGYLGARTNLFNNRIRQVHTMLQEKTTEYGQRFGY